jgi:hypothetical protein
MPLSHIALENLTEPDLQGLIAGAVPEGRRIEYKRDLPGTNDEAKRELLADVTSFANAAGGDLLYGIVEDGGQARGIPGVSGDADAEILRLEAIIRTGVDPRIPGVHLRAIPLVSGSFVLVIRIPQSWALPHMITLKGLSRFFSRTSAGKYQLDVAELRSLFARSADAGEQIRRFRDERLARIVAGEGAFPVSGSGLIVLHLIPMRMADPASRFDLRQLHRQQISLPPLYAGGWDNRYNLDGFVTWSPGVGQKTSYLQVFRHGAMEAVDAGMLNPQGAQRLIPSTLLARQLLEKIPKYLEVQRQLGVDPPIVILLTLVGVEGFRLSTSHAWDRRGRHRESFGTPLDRDLIPCPESILDDWDKEVPLLLRSPFDAIWNAAGHPECSFYDASGQWVGE